MKSTGGTTSRRRLLGAFAGVAVLSAAPVYANAAGFLRNAGDVRRISMRNKRTGESIDTIYWIEGEYITPSLKEISYFMRDWRRGEVINYDRRNIDILAASPAPTAAPASELTIAITELESPAAATSDSPPTPYRQATLEYDLKTASDSPAVDDDPLVDLLAESELAIPL